jgi:hypothetical protein
MRLDRAPRSARLTDVVLFGAWSLPLLVALSAIAGGVIALGRMVF